MASVELKLNPFPRPEFVTVQLPSSRHRDGFGYSPKIRTVDLTLDQLTDLINDFSKSMVEKWVDHNSPKEPNG